MIYLGHHNYVHSNQFFLLIAFSERRRWTLKIQTDFHVNNPIIKKGETKFQKACVCTIRKVSKYNECFSVSAMK